MSELMDKILAKVTKLPPFPKVLDKVLSLLDDPDVAVGELVEVVQLDPSLTANVLQQVNSAYYGLPRQVNNLDQALAYLGNERFQEVVTASAAVRILAGEQPGYDLPQGQLWRHSIAVAMMTQVLAQQAGVKPGSALYTAALLHDIGKVVLSSFVGDRISVILEAVDQGASFLEAEKEILGLDHAAVGGRIAQEWRFSDEMVELIAFHHEPEKRPESEDLALLYLADLACQLLGLGVGVDGLAYRGRQAAMKKFGFKEKDLELAMAELHQNLSRAEVLLEMDS
ncbi:MAG: HDOD domain-containing protein [Deltaproteobacteria bacterium]|nr:HDOD domain-containing protein [Deltaproteobacteria bacterium]